jgi:hypothetical protein
MGIARIGEKKERSEEKQKTAKEGIIGEKNQKGKEEKKDLTLLKNNLSISDFKHMVSSRIITCKN